MTWPSVLSRSSSAGNSNDEARCRHVIARAASVTVITVIRQLVAVIAKGFILAKDNYLISAKILRDNKILRDFGPRSANGRLIVLARRLLKRKAGPLPRRRALAVRPAVPVGKDCTFSSG